MSEGVSDVETQSPQQILDAIVEDFANFDGREIVIREAKLDGNALSLLFEGRDSPECWLAMRLSPEMAQTWFDKMPERKPTVPELFADVQYAMSRLQIALEAAEDRKNLEF